MDTSSEKSDGSSEPPARGAAPTPPAAEASSGVGGSSTDSAPPPSSAEQRQAALDAAEQEALEMLDESAARARAGQPWGGPSSALQGLLRKLGAGLDDLLPGAGASHGRLKTILTGLRGADEGLQLVALSELCEMLSIGTEESLVALSVDVFAPLLISLLRAEHNPDLMLLASRALCHMMDAIPSSSAAIVHFDGVPLFCERLLSIEYIDLAEQALHALEKLSQEHPLALLRAGGMLAVLQYVDFFAMGVQRRAVATAANMCRGLPVECAHLVADSVPLLSNMLTHHDQKLLENACLAFSRLSESFAHSPVQLEMLAAQGLLPNLLRLVGGMVHGAIALPDAPVALSDATYTMLLRTLAALCRGSPPLTKQLLQLDASSVLHDVLTADDAAATDGVAAAAVSRPHDQLYQILSLAHELLPPLPKPPSASSVARGAAAAAASAAASAAAAASASAAAAPKRRSKRGGAEADGSQDEGAVDVKGPAAAERPPTAREQALLDQPELVELYAQRLFVLFALVHSGAINASVRSKSLSCMAKVLHFYPLAGLREMVQSHSIAAFLAPLLTTQDTNAAGVALSMAEILLTKLPVVYTEMFLREGVFDAVAKLAAPAMVKEEPAAAPPQLSSGKVATPVDAAPPVPAPSLPLRRTSRGRPAESGDGSAPAGEAQRRRSSGGSSSSLVEPEAPPAPLGAMAPPAPRAPHAAGSTALSIEAASAVAVRAAALYTRFVACDDKLAAAVASGEGSATLQKLHGLASALSDAGVYSTRNPCVPLAGAWTAFADVNALRQLASLLDDVSATSGLSTFELAKSGLVESLLAYLTASGEGEAGEEALERRRVRLRVFCSVFLNLPPPSLPAAAVRKGLPAAPASPGASAARAPGSPVALCALVTKLQDVLNMTERFPLVLNDTSSSDPNSHGLKALTQPFKLRLARAPDEGASLREYAANVVLIEPLATVGAIEEFLWPKVRRSAEARASRESERDEEEGEADAAEEAAAAADAASSSGLGEPRFGAAWAASQAARASSGSAGKTPLRGAVAAPPPTAGSSARAKKGGRPSVSSAGRVGVVLSGFGGALGGPSADEDEDEDDDPMEDEDEEGDGSVMGSPAFGSEAGECVHDLQLNSSPDARASQRDSAKGLGSCMLPSPAAASRKGGSSRAAAGGSSAAAAAGSASGRASPSTTAPGAASTDSSPAAGSARPSAPSAASAALDADAAVADASVPAERTQKLVLLLNGRPLPYGTSIFQAVRQSGVAAPPAPAAAPGAAAAAAASLSQRLWGAVYTLHYRLATPADEALSDGVSSATGEGGAAEAETGREATVLALDANPLLGPLSSDTPPLSNEPPEPAAPVLHLLAFLHRLNEQWACLYSPAEMAEAARPRGPALLPAVFCNSKLTAKLMRQLQDPLALCSRSFPPWCAALTSSCPFLFSFASRRLYLHSTAFGLSRALGRLQAHASEGGGAGSATPSETRLGRLPRQKVRIARSRVVDSAVKVMELYSGQKALLEVEYFGEVGTGLGPTLEFYALVSHELRKAELNLWHHEETAPETVASEAADTVGAAADRAREKLVHAPCGLFPRPVVQSAEGGGVPKRVTQLFTLMGRFIAKALLDNRLVDLTFAPPFYRHLLGAELGLDDLRELSPQLARSLGQLEALAHERTQLLATVGAEGRSAEEISEAVAGLTLHGCPVDQLGLDWTLPGFPEYELVPGGKDKEVTIDTLGDYVERVVRTLLLDGVRAQLRAFKAGFSEVFGVWRLGCFSPAELDVLFNGARERWEKAVVIEQLKFDHGYTRSSQAVGYLLDVLAELTDEQLASFLKVRKAAPPNTATSIHKHKHHCETTATQPELASSIPAYAPLVLCSVCDGQPTPARGRSSASLAAADDCAEEARRQPLVRRIPALGHDVCKLPQAARLLLQGCDARAAAHRGQRGPGRLSPLVRRLSQDGTRARGEVGDT